MKKEVHYLVYDPDLSIVGVFKYWGKAIMNLLDTREDLRWLNTSHSEDQKILRDIDRINYTNYADNETN